MKRRCICLRSIHILPQNIHSSWVKFLDENILIELAIIENKIGNSFTPPVGNILRFLFNDLNKLKVIILGQDPYPEKGIATGRAFEVGGLNLWNTKFKQVSLKNIVRLLHKTYNNIDNYEDIYSFNYIRKEIINGQFKILPLDEIFKSWEKQGVLLLNSYLTCEVGKPGSHREVWAAFAGKLIDYIVEQRPDLNWFLWGRNANAFSGHIKNGCIYSCRHPMMCSREYEDDFLKSDCFKKTNSIINWLGE